MSAAWILYSILHFSHLSHHESDPHHASGSKFVFLGSMVAHCWVSGMLLVLSADFSTGINRTVFFALLAHKAYEALAVSSLLVDERKSRLASIFAITIYSLSFPLGALLTVLLHSMITQTVAWIATSLAVGTLGGCLLFDFLLPSLAHLKRKRHDLAWIAVGLFVTQLVMRVL